MSGQGCSGGVGHARLLKALARQEALTFPVEFITVEYSSANAVGNCEVVYMVDQPFGDNQELLWGQRKKPRPAAGASNHLAFVLLRTAVALFPVPAVSQPEHVPDAGRQSSVGRRASRLAAPGPWLRWPASHGCG